MGIEPTTLDLCSQSGAYNLSAMAIPVFKIKLIELELPQGFFYTELQHE